MKGTIQRTPAELGLEPGQFVLTLDDGPGNVEETERLLSVLDNHGVHVVFCLIGALVERVPESVQLLKEAGHLLVNHSWSHRSPLGFCDEEFREDLRRGDAALCEATGETQPSPFFRPPGGLWNEKVARVCEEEGKQMMPITWFAWDVMPVPQPARFHARRFLARARRDQGGIFLLHERLASMRGEFPDEFPPVRPWLVDCVDQMLSGAKAGGMTFPEPREIFQAE